MSLCFFSTLSLQKMASHAQRNPLAKLLNQRSSVLFLMRLIWIGLQSGVKDPHVSAAKASSRFCIQTRRTVHFKIVSPCWLAHPLIGESFNPFSVVSEDFGPDTSLASAEKSGSSESSAPSHPASDPTDCPATLARRLLRRLQSFLPKSERFESLFE